MSAEGRERFLRAIAERIDADRVEEVHVFPAIRQGGRESGVAVLTIRPEDAVDVSEDSAAAESAPDPEEIETRAEGSGEEPADVSDDSVVEAAPPAPPRRFTVLRAHYLLTLKGPDRGKWEVGVVEEAEAPAATVDEVVRGVHERAGGWGRGAEVPERLTGDDFRAALVEEPWTATRH